MKGCPKLTVLFCCYSLIVLLMNQELFPLYDSVFTHARDVSITFSSVVVIVGALLSICRPGLFRPATMVRTGFLLVLSGAALLCGALLSGWAPLLVVSSCVVSAGRAFATIHACLCAVDVASRLPRGRVLASVPAGYCLAAGVDIALAGLPAAVHVVLVALVLPLAMLVLSREGAMRNLADLAASVPAVDLSVTRPASFLPLTSTFYVFQFVAFVAFGFALRFGEEGGSPVSGLAATFVGQALLLGCVLASRGRLRYDGLCTLIVLLLTAGFFFAVADVHDGAYVANSVLMVGNSLYNVLVLCTLVSLAARNHLNSLAVFGWSNGLAGLGTTLGATVGVAVNRLLGQGSHEAAVYLVIAVALSLVAYALYILRGFSFDEAIAGVEAVEQTPQPAAEVQARVAGIAEDAFEARCRELAVSCGLTPREEETFAMLARGRNREYIEEQLMVSRNTVKAHVKHVYAKLGIHSHQELLDLVGK